VTADTGVAGAFALVSSLPPGPDGVEDVETSESCALYLGRRLHVGRRLREERVCGEDGTMDQLWSPWRFAYVTTADGAPRPGVPARLNAWPGDLGCVFCNLIASVEYAIEKGMSADEAEEAGGLIKRGKSCFICLNAYPYTSGHVMVMPYAHLDRIAKLDSDAAHELMDMVQLTERALERLYRPHGFNFGLNLGQAAGAGVAGHLHMHAMPRWIGDTNFMTTVAETRVLPEDLGTSWKRLRGTFAELEAL
jgi:ATP adenylyltransferase